MSVRNDRYDVKMYRLRHKTDGRFYENGRLFKRKCDASNSLNAQRKYNHTTKCWESENKDDWYVVTYRLVETNE